MIRTLAYDPAGLALPDFLRPNTVISWLVEGMSDRTTHWSTRAEFASALGSLARIPPLTSSLVGTSIPPFVSFLLHVCRLGAYVSLGLSYRRHTYCIKLLCMCGDHVDLVMLTCTLGVIRWGRHKVGLPVYQRFLSRSHTQTHVKTHLWSMVHAHPLMVLSNSCLLVVPVLSGWQGVQG